MLTQDNSQYQNCCPLNVIQKSSMSTTQYLRYLLFGFYLFPLQVSQAILQMSANLEKVMLQSH